MYSKTKLNLTITEKDKYDKTKQIRALMPNLIHSLDANGLCTLYYFFSKHYISCQFFGVHDCFGTTAKKVFMLKTTLASVYTDIYTKDKYLINFDKDILDMISTKPDLKLENRVITLMSGKTYELHDLD